MKLKHFLIASGILLLVLAILMFPLHTAHAAGGTLTASSTEIETGESVTLTVTVAGENIGGFQARLSTGDVVASATSNTDSAVFTPSSAGTYVISATGLIALTNQEEISFTTNSVTIEVKDPSPSPSQTPGGTSAPTAVPTQTQKPGATPDPNATEPPDKTPIPEEGDKATPAPTEDTRPYIRTSGGDVYIALRIPQDIPLPAGCERESAVIKNRYVEACSFGGSNYLIVYTTDQTGGNGELRIFDRDTETFVEPVSATVPAAEYRVYSLSSALEAPEGFSPASITINGETVRVFRDTAREGFYLVLAQDESGDLGFYLYDETRKTLQRYIGADEQLKTTIPTQEPEPDDTEPVLAAVEEQTPPASPVNAWKIAAISAMLCSIVLLGALSVLLFVHRRRNTDAASAEEAVMNDLLSEEAALDSEKDPFADLAYLASLSEEDDIFKNEK
ncbi:MAG: hypothetical protein IJJ34_07470 [Clostridia bacterium]|nr:hypothetical protein [Clostridia bacterium]